MIDEEKIMTALGKEEILAQLAEECNELAHAALKLRRVLGGKNPTPVTKKEAMKNLLEEIADVDCCVNILIYDADDVKKIYQMAQKKEKRWLERLDEKRM